MNIAGVHLALGEINKDAELLRNAIDRYFEALALIPKEDEVEKWSEANLGLAIAKRGLGRVTKDAASFDQAESHYE